MSSLSLGVIVKRVAEKDCRILEGFLPVFQEVFFHITETKIELIDNYGYISYNYF